MLYDQRTQLTLGWHQHTQEGTLAQAWSAFRTSWAAAEAVYQKSTTENNPCSICHGSEVNPSHWPSAAWTCWGAHTTAWGRCCWAWRHTSTCNHCKGCVPRSISGTLWCPALWLWQRISWGRKPRGERCWEEKHWEWGSPHLGTNFSGILFTGSENRDACLVWRARRSCRYKDGPLPVKSQRKTGEYASAKKVLKSSNEEGSAWMLTREGHEYIFDNIDPYTPSGLQLEGQQDAGTLA